MGKARALVNRLKRREKKVRNDADGFDRINKMNREEETMANSPKAYQLMRKVARRSDRNFGIDSINHEPKISKRENILTVERFDYDAGPGTDYGVRLTMAAGLIADIGAQPGDVVFFLEGNLKGEYLKVIAVTDSTHLRLEDSTKESDPGKAEKTQVQCVADVASSLNNTYFTLHSAADATAYYVWYNVGGAGVDPAPGGTGIMVAIAANASALTVAAATAAAVDASADFVAATDQSKVIVTNAAVGTATDAADTGSTGFTITVLVQGSAASATLSESNIVARFQLSDVKGKYL